MENGPDKLLLKVTGALVEAGVLAYSYSRHGFVVANCAAASLASWTVVKLIELIWNGGRRLIKAIRNRDAGNSVFTVIINEIHAMGSEALDDILEYVFAVINFLKELINEGFAPALRFTSRQAQITSEMQEKALMLSSGSYVRRT